MKKDTYLFFLFFLLSGIILMSCGGASDQPAEETTAETAVELEEPDPDLVYIGDIPVYTKFEALEPLFHQENDSVYVINFWATWCKPCVEELPYFEDLHKKYKDQKVRVVLVSLDFPRQIEKKVLPFVEKHQLQSDVVVLAETNSNNFIDKVDPTWSGAIPVTVIYNAKDRKFINSQLADYEELEEIVKNFL